MKTKTHLSMVSSLILILVFAASWSSEYAGIHALFGAFLAGIVSPHTGDFAEKVSRMLEPLALTVMLPLFFSYSGIRTNIGLIAPL